MRRLWDSHVVTVCRLKRVRYGCVFLPARIPVGTWVEMNQREANDLYDLVRLARKTVKRKSVKEKEGFVRQAMRQKVRQEAGKPNKRKPS